MRDDVALRQFGLTYYVADKEIAISTADDQASLCPVEYDLSDTGISRESVAQLVEVIGELIAPVTWKKVGGWGLITPSADGKQLEISQTPRVHRDVRELVGALQSTATILPEPSGGERAIDLLKIKHLEAPRRDINWYVKYAKFAQELKTPRRHELIQEMANKNLDELIEVASMGMYVEDIYGPITAKATNAQKPLIFLLATRMSRAVDLIHVKGWLAEFRPRLIAGLEEDTYEDIYIPIRHLSSLKRPQDLSLILECIKLEPRLFPNAANELKDFKTCDLTALASECWAARHSYFLLSSELAPKAAEYGIADSLQYMVESLANRKDGNLRGFPQILDTLDAALHRSVEKQGSTEEIIQWYKDNKEQIVFDQQKRKFVVKK